MRKKVEADQLVGITKTERLSLILATYQRNLELTERKLAASQQENIDLQVQLHQLMQSAKGGGVLSGPSNLHMNPISEELNPESVSSQQALLLQENHKNQAMFTALTEQIRELKQQMLHSKNTPPSSSLSSSSLAAVGPTSTIINDGNIDIKDKSEKPKPAIGKAMSNPYGFESMAECLEYISELEGEHGRRALSLQLQAAQERAIELSMRNMSLEEELLAYRQYMKQIVAKHKTEMAQLQRRMVVGKQPPPHSSSIDSSIDVASEGNYVKLPLIKL